MYDIGGIMGGGKLKDEDVDGMYVNGE